MTPLLKLHNAQGNCHSCFVSAANSYPRSFKTNEFVGIVVAVTKNRGRGGIFVYLQLHYSVLVKLSHPMLDSRTVCS